jgi:hypothetical protein
MGRVYYSVSHICRVPDADTGRRAADALQSRMPSGKVTFAVLQDLEGWRVVANYREVKPIRIRRAIRFAEIFLANRGNIWPHQ